MPEAHLVYGSCHLNRCNASYPLGEEGWNPSFSIFQTLHLCLLYLNTLFSEQPHTAWPVRTRLQCCHEVLAIGQPLWRANPFSHLHLPRPHLGSGHRASRAGAKYHPTLLPISPRPLRRELQNLRGRWEILRDPSQMGGQSSPQGKSLFQASLGLEAELEPQSDGPLPQTANQQGSQTEDM